MRERLLVIADDLTGALDTAVQFSRAGVSTFVAEAGGAWAGAPWTGVDAAVIAVDLESRHLPPGEAGDRVRRCVDSAGRAGIRRFYKKTDSTLRGNIGAELQALLLAAGSDELYFVPAHPAAGRITRAGVQYVDGLPLHRSRYSRDPVDPVRESSVAAIIASQADAAAVNVPRGGDPAAVRTGAGRPAILVFDAETDADLAAIAGRLAALGPPRLLAGCAGFAALVPGLLGLQRGAVPAVSLRSPLLVVCGSQDEVSRAQVRDAEDRGVSARNPARAGWTDAVIDEVMGDLRARGCAILQTGGWTAGADELVRRVCVEAAIGTLAVFGGDTAFGVIRALGADGMWPLGEICQGVVVSRFEGKTAGGPPTGIRLVTKAGGFGPVDVIQRIREALDKEG